MGSHERFEAIIESLAFYWLSLNRQPGDGGRRAV